MRLPLKVVHGIATFLGWLIYHLPTRARKTTLRNLEACFPEMQQPELACLACKSLQHTAKMALESGRCWFWPIEKTLNMIVEIKGLQFLTNAQNSNKGIIILVPHLGNWELTGLYFGQVMPTTFLYQPPKVSSFDTMIKAARSRGNLLMAPTNRQGIALLLRAIKKGEAAGILPDQEPGLEGGEFAPFFGTPALTMTLATRLISRTDARVICAFAERLPEAKGFKLHIEEADPLVFDIDPIKSVEGLNRSVEHAVRKIPEQYQWEYKRFKRKLDGSRFYD